MKNSIMSNFKYDVIDKAILNLFGLYFILKPFYLWNSGLPQISDFVLICTMIFYMLKNKLTLKFNKVSLTFIILNFILIFYIFWINGLWSLLSNGKIKFIRVSSFYFFNFLAITMVLSFYTKYGKDLLETVYKSVLVSIFIQLFLYFISGGFSASRAIVFFNNPNQLGYYSLLTLVILLLLSQTLEIKMLWFIGGIIAALVLCFASLSKAAILSCIGMILYFILIKRKSKIFNKNWFFIVIVITLLIAVVYKINKDIIASNKLIQAVENRLLGIGKETDSNLVSRGYDRILNNPKYLIFGAGEGDYLRFGERMEFHSTLGNILLSYGIIGLGIYMYSLVYVFKNNKWKDLYLLIFIMLYGLTHNGIRNTLLWIFIAIVSITELEADKSMDINL